MGIIFEKLGAFLLALFQQIGEMLLLFFNSCRYSTEFKKRRARKRLYEQILHIGADSVMMVSILGAFVGMVLALQTGYQLRKIGGEGFIGAVVALSLVRELAPVFTGYLLAGRIGAAITAEIGTMSVHEEIDALRALGISPVKYLAVPRIIAGIIVTPMLVVFADIMGILGGAGLAVTYLQVSLLEYKNSIIELTRFDDICVGLIKGAVFGGIVCLVGCHQGFSTSNGARGVGKYTTRSVVIAFMSILIADYFLSRIML